MDRAGKIKPQPWMDAPTTLAVIAALSADGAPARFVGGCVRDAILERPVKDIDIATSSTPEQVIALLERAGIRAVPTGINHGTITAVTGGAHFEVTTLRHDVETFGRHARVAFTDDWEADAARRDFTMNALFCDPDGTLYDPTGGLDDLKAGRVRFVGAARERIEEDVLRLLRFFRFQAWYGVAAPDTEAIEACREMADRLPMLSAERVWAELSRLLAAPDPSAMLDLMSETGVLDQVLSEAGDRARLARLGALESRHAVAADAIRRLAAALGGGAVDTRGLGDRLRMSRRDCDRLGKILKNAGLIAPDAGARETRRRLHRLGVALFRDIVLVDWAADEPDRSDLWRAAGDWSPVELPVGGDDVMALGIPKGPRVGRLLRRVEKWWVGEDFAPDRAACLAHLKDEGARGKTGSS